MSVPARGELRGIVPHLAAKIAESIGQRSDLAALAVAIDGITARVASSAPDHEEITFVFRQTGGDLLIEAHCGGRSTEVRCPQAA